jgi:hypothetical protein
LGRHCGQADHLELVYRPPRAIADGNHFRGESNGGNGDDTFPGRAERRKTVITAADDTGHKRRRELDHHMPGHRHDVDMAIVGSRQEDDRSRLQQTIDLVQRKFPH